MARLPHRANWFPNGSVAAKLKLPGETEAGSAGTRPCRGTARRAHRNDEVGACESGVAPLRQTLIGSKDPHALKIPARRAESYITKSASLHIPGSQDDLAQTSSKQLSCYTSDTPRLHSLPSLESADLPDLPTDSPEEPSVPLSRSRSHRQGFRGASKISPYGYDVHLSPAPQAR